MTEEELTAKELVVDITAPEVAEQRMPGQQSMYSYWEFILNPGSREMKYLNSNFHDVADITNLI